MPVHRKGALPKRTCNKAYANYSSFKPFLKVDFNGSCGYCDCADYWYDSFHIDHFAPQELFKELECDYSNLVYACPSCNLLKKHDWPTNDATISYTSDKGYYDPCVVDYNTIFERDDKGNIILKTDDPIAVYMHDKFKFNLQRHKIVWNLSHLKELLDKLRRIDLDKLGEPKKTEIKSFIAQLYDYYQSYLNLHKGAAQ